MKRVRCNLFFEENYRLQAYKLEKKLSKTTYIKKYILKIYVKHNHYDY